MIGFLLLSLPVFAVVALGFAATRCGFAPPGALDALGAFAFRFALPALVFRLIALQPLERSFNPAFYAGYLTSGAAVFVTALALWRGVEKRPLAQAGARATTATVSNLGFLGPPLMLAFFGERGAGPLAMAILAEVMVLFSLGAVIIGGARHGGGTGRALMRGTLLNPLVAAIFLGAAVAASGAPLPAPLERFLGFLGGAAGPTALFALGGTLALQRVDRATLLAASAISAAKLVVYPLVAWVVLTRLFAVEPFWAQAGALMASLPPAGNNYVLAQRYAADAEQISTAIVLSTLVSVATVPLVAWLLLR